MFEIKGKYATAKCYCDEMEKEAADQIKMMCDYCFAENSRIAIMPDVHAGKGCTIGTTMTVKDKVVPNIVGVDIGCGMYAVKLKEKDIDFKKLDEVVHSIPSGQNVWEKKREDFDFLKLSCYEHLKNIEWLECSLGSLGGGNHFIEIDKANDGTLFLIIHSGSRNLGKQVAEYHQNQAILIHSNKANYAKEREDLIERLKAEGKEQLIMSELRKLKCEAQKRKPDMPNELCYLEGEEMKAYLNDVEICQRFALRNRELMAEVLLKETGLTAVDAFHTIHNYIDTKEMILRKGSIAAHEGEKVLIPINMRDGSVLATGKGNAEWNYSAPHGAGRIMSRMKAKSTLTLGEYLKAMEGIYTTSVNRDTLDEAPMAYKSLESIMKYINETVDVIEVLKPIYNFKASE